MRRSIITRAARHLLPMVKGATTVSADRQSSSSAERARPSCPSLCRRSQKGRSGTWFLATQLWHRAPCRQQKPVVDAVAGSRRGRENQIAAVGSQRSHCSVAVDQHIRPHVCRRKSSPRAAITRPKVLALVRHKQTHKPPNTMSTSATPEIVRKTDTAPGQLETQIPASTMRSMQIPSLFAAMSRARRA